jgi:hypothetical protein
MNTTDWFPINTHPGRPGVYQTNAAGHVYQNWTGEYWGCFDFTPDLALRVGKAKSLYQDVKWRGLTEQV